MEFLYSIDVALFHFFNSTLGNPIGDFLWPYITDYDKQLPVRIILLGCWVLLIVKGGKKGRTVALLMIPVLFISDKLSSEIIKPFFNRPRPCHEVDGYAIVDGIRLLVHCGSGRSLPSSHAVNNFAVATVFAHYFVRWKWALLGWAAIVAISRVAVGVHYPSDIIVGALIGTLVGFAVVWLWTFIDERYLTKKK